MARNAPWNWNEKVVGADGKATPEFLAWLQQQLAVNEVAGAAVPQSRRIDTGTGLTGGGDLSADRTISLDAVIDDLNDVDTATNPPVDGQALIWDNLAGDWVPGDVATSLEVDEEGAPVSTDVNTINFTGGVTVTDDGGGQVTVDISGGTGSAKTWDHMWGYATSASGASAASKASRVRPIKDISIDGISTLLFNKVNGAVYQAYIVTLSGFNVATVLGSSATITATNNNPDLLLFEFIAPVTLTAGTEYGLIITRTDSSTTYQLPVPSTSTALRYCSAPLMVTGYMTYTDVNITGGETAASSGSSPDSYLTGVRYSL